MHRKFTLFLLLFLNFSLLTHAQFLEVEDGSSSGLSPDEYAAQVLQNSDFQVISVVYEGAFDAMGAFSANGESPIGISHGMVLSTGRVTANSGHPGIISASSDFAGGGSSPNITVDADLSQLDPNNGNNDIARMTVEFIPLTDTLVVDLIFASEEYPEYSCSAFNDIFGLFLSGPGINGTFSNNAENIARIPGTDTYISINNLHPDDTCPAENEEFYINNSETETGFPTPLVFDGLTTVIPIRWPVTPFETYTMKLAIADKGDSAFDSATFLQFSDCTSGFCGFFTPEKAMLAENCEPAKVYLDVTNAPASILPLEITLAGDAINGVDYEALSDTYVLTQDNPILDFDIVPIIDGEMEGVEKIELLVSSNGEHVKSVFYYLNEEFSLDVQAIDNCDAGVQVVMTEAANNIYEFENNNSIIIDPVGEMINSEIQVNGLPYSNLFSPQLIKEVCVNVDHSWVEDIDLYLLSPDGARIVLTTNNGQNGDNYTNTCFSPTAETSISGGFPNAPSSFSPFSGEWQPEGLWSDIANTSVNGTWTLQVKDDDVGFTGVLLDWSITFHESVLAQEDIIWSNGETGTSFEYDGEFPVSFFAEVTNGYCSTPFTFEINETTQGAAVYALNETTCDPTFSLLVEGQIFDIDNLTGDILIEQGSYTGCDSIIAVNLSFLEAEADVIMTEDYIDGQPITVQGQIFSTPGHYTISVEETNNNCAYDIELSLLPPVPDYYYDFVENETSIFNECSGGEYCVDISRYGTQDYELLLDGESIGNTLDFASCNTITEHLFIIPAGVYDDTQVWEIAAIDGNPTSTVGKFSGAEDFLQHLNYVAPEANFYGIFDINVPKIITRTLPDIESITIYNEATDDTVVLTAEELETATGATILLTGNETELSILNPQTSTIETFALNYAFEIETTPSILFVDFIETNTSINDAFFTAVADELCGPPVSATSICNGSEIIDIDVVLNEEGGADVNATVYALLFGDVEMCIELCDAYGICDTVTQIWTYSLVDVKEVNTLSQSIDIYPNPAQNEFVITLNDTENIINSVGIFSLNGQEIRQEKLSSEGRISITDLATGVYLLKIDTENGVARKRLVVTR